MSSANNCARNCTRTLQEPRHALFDEAEIAGVQRMADLIPVMRRAMIDFSTGRIA
jgi:hypothetical protein